MKATHGAVPTGKWEQRSTNTHVYKDEGVELIVRKKSEFSFHVEVRVFERPVAWTNEMSLDQAKGAAQDQLELWLLQRLSTSRGVHVLDLLAAIRDVD